MTARSHMDGWLHNERGRRVTRRERNVARQEHKLPPLPKLRSDGKKAHPRENSPLFQRHMNPSVITIHRRIVRDLYGQLSRLLRGRYCWAPPRWQLAMLEAQDGTEPRQP